MSELQSVIEQAYETAKSGQWERLLSDWHNSELLLNRCSRYKKPGSLWSFLHQAAYFGNEQACRALIQRGSSVDGLTHDSRTPADIAEQRGHHELAIFLRAASTGQDSLWAPPMDPDVRPSSNRWREATEATANVDLFVAYGGGLVRIPKGSPYFVDSLGRVLVGWHGTFNPPCGMDGESMITPMS